jgi:hypothetical protein
LRAFANTVLVATHRSSLLPSGALAALTTTRLGRSIYGAERVEGSSRRRERRFATSKHSALNCTWFFMSGVTHGYTSARVNPAMVTESVEAPYLCIARRYGSSQRRATGTGVV